MRMNELINKLKDMDESEYAREMIEGYCNHFMRYGNELREKVLGEETLMKIGGALKSMRELAEDKYSKSMTAQLLPNGMYVKPKKHRNEELHDIWTRKVPDNMSVRDCMGVLGEIGIDVRVLIEKVNKKERELGGVRHECQVPF